VTPAHACRIAGVAHARVLCAAMHTHSRFARPYRPSRAAFSTVPVGNQIAEYSAVLALWLVRLSACRSPGYGGPEGSHACASCPASTSGKKTRAVPRGGRAAARLRRQPIPRALTTRPAGTRKRSIAVQETGRCGCAGGSVVTGVRLDVRDLAQIPGGHLGAGLPKVLRAVVSRRYEGTHRTPRSSSSPAIRRPAGPGPPPAAPVTSTSPLTRALLSVPRRLARQHYNQ
jgi:hypothetical protein